jgi:large subunit ribosomal protein L19
MVLCCPNERALRTSRQLGGHKMNNTEIIKNIEAAQMKEQTPEFHVGDTVKVYGKIIEGNRERVQVFEGTVL